MSTRARNIDRRHRALRVGGDLRPSRPLRAVRQLASAVVTLAALVFVGAVDSVVAAYGPRGQDVVADPDAAWLELVLTAEGVDADGRRGAAERLLTSPRPSKVASLLRALESQRPEVIAAVVEAMLATDLWPSDVVDRLAGRLPSAMHDVDVGERTRVAIATALGRVPTRPSLDALVQVLAAASGVPESRRVEAAAMASLERLTRRQFGADREAWIEWWRHAHDRPLEELLELSVDAIRAQLDRARAIEQGLRDENEQLQSRLAALQSEMLIQLQPEQRQERLVRLLGDGVPAVRRMAIEHIDRNFPGVQIPADAVYTALLGVLADPVATNRAAAARLLERLNRPGVGEQVAPRFVEETNPEAVEAYLTILRRSPTPAVADRLVVLVGATSGPLATARIVDDAARALAGLVEASTLDAQTMDAVRATLRSRVAPLLDLDEPIPSLPPIGTGVLRLFAMLADSDDLERLVSHLRSTEVGSPRLDSGQRRAIADALRHRRERATLLELVDDDAVYPALMRSLSEDHVTLAQFAMIINHVRNGAEAGEQGRFGEWRRAVVRAAAAMSPGELLAGDDLLAAIDPATINGERILQLRREVLSRLVELPESTPELVRLTRRLGSVELDLGLPAEAARTLAAIAGDGAESTRRLRFLAAALAGDYSSAMAIDGDPSRWIDAITWAADRGAWDSAAVLLDEVMRVFPAGHSSMTPELLAKLKEVSDLVRATRIEPGPPADTSLGQGASARRINESVSTVGPARDEAALSMPDTIKVPE